MPENNISFESMREQIIEYLKGQEQFKDFNYVAPAISTLIDALAYTSNLLSTYANFSINEVFLQTASKRSSIVSKAANLGYIPHQYGAAVAKIRLEYIGKIPLETGANPDVLSNYVVPKDTIFTVTNDGQTFYFKTKNNFPIKQTAQGSYYADLEISEGTTITERFTQDDYLLTNFILSNRNVDLDTLEVIVYKNSSDTKGIKFYRLEDIIQLTDKANEVYNVIENTNGDIQLFFGDGIQALAILPGMIVECIYDVVSGEDANNLNVFTLSNFPAGSDINNWIINKGSNNWSVKTLQPSASGVNRESDENIRMNAPHYYQRQYRNVTADDYKADILHKYGGLLSGLNVWGGENNIPPKYGSVIICAKPKIGEMLPQVHKDEIIKYLKSKMVICITPEIIDPSVVYVDLNVNIKYNKQTSAIGPTTIQKKCFDLTRNFFLETANTFDCSFNYARYLNEIFNISEFITDVIVTTYVNRYITVNIRNTAYSIESRIPIKPNSIVFGPYYDANIGAEVTVNDKDGVLEKRNSGAFLETVGKVNYETGYFSFNDIKFTSNTDIQLRYEPAEHVFSVSRNDVFSIRNIVPIATGV